jgi:DNA-directed RNA polymerase specialized sigma24 family protein
MLYKDLNEAYTRWSTTHEGLEELLVLVRRLVMSRYYKVDRAAEDIAQIVTIRVWRSLLGDLKPHDPSTGDFSKYVTMQAVCERKKFYRSDRLVLVDEPYLEQLQHNAQLKEIQAQDPIAFEQAVEK